MIGLDMEKPKSCWECRFHSVHHDNKCFFNHKYTDDPYFSKHIYDDCPLIDVQGIFDCGYSLGCKNAKGERSRGEWVLKETDCDDGGNNRYECANCHYTDIHSESAEVPFCWHCGAEMKSNTKQGG